MQFHWSFLLQHPKNKSMNNQQIKSLNTYSLSKISYIPNYWQQLTRVSQEHKHRDKDVVNKVKADTIGKYGIPEDKQVLHGELSPKQQAEPPAAATETIAEYSSM